MGLYQKIINIGAIYAIDARQQKRVLLLNTYILIWMHLSCFFILLDLIFSPPNKFLDILIHVLSISFLSFLLLLNHHNKFDISRVLYLTFSFIIFYILSFVTTFSSYTVCYFIFLPLVVMSLYKSNVPAYFFLVICLLTYSLSDLWLKEITDSKQFYRTLILLKDPVVTSLFIAGFYLFHYFKKMNHINEEKLEQAYLELEERKKGELAHLQLKSLKAQMNPHFMFNAMNSIQNLILKGNRQEAYDYLAKFSLMIRENLRMSEKSFVSFEEELSLIKKYLELEKLRFIEDFNYQIINQVGKNLSNSIKIPSMIIQPFIENAIKHGLLHKADGNRNVKIEFYKKEVFTCIVTDNGVGLKKSKEINHQNEIKTKSFSTKAIEDRLLLLKDYYKVDIGFYYEPIEEGTKVVIKIPYLLDE